MQSTGCEEFNYGIYNIERVENGIREVSLTKLQMSLLNRGLSESKNVVDNLLNGEIIKIKESNKQLAEQFVSQATEIGVICFYSAD